MKNAEIKKVLKILLPEKQKIRSRCPWSWFLEMEKRKAFNECRQQMIKNSLKLKEIKL